MQAFVVEVIIPSKVLESASLPLLLRLL